MDLHFHQKPRDQKSMIPKFNDNLIKQIDKIVLLDNRRLSIADIIYINIGALNVREQDRKRTVYFLLGAMAGESTPRIALL